MRGERHVSILPDFLPSHGTINAFSTISFAATAAKAVVRHNDRVNMSGSPSPATEMDRVADALDWSLNRDEWWGPARLAYDAEIRWLRDCARSLAAEIRSLA